MVQQETPGGVGVSSSVYGAVFSGAGLIAGAVTGGAAALVGYGGVLWVCAALSAVAALGMLARLALPRAVSPPPADLADDWEYVPADGAGEQDFNGAAGCM